MVHANCIDWPISQLNAGSKLNEVECSLSWNTNDNFPLIKFDVSSIWEGGFFLTFETPCQSLFIFRSAFISQEILFFANEKVDESKTVTWMLHFFLRACQTHLRIKFSKSRISRKSFCFLTSPVQRTQTWTLMFLKNWVL